MNNAGYNGITIQLIFPHAPTDASVKKHILNML